MPGDEDLALTIYQALRAGGGFSTEEALCKAAGVDAEQAQRGRKRLYELGLIQVTDGVLEPVEPDTALVRTMDSYHAIAAEQVRNATALQQLTQSLMAVYRPAVASEASQVEVEYITDRRRKDSTMIALAATARGQVDSMHPGPMPSMQVLEKSLGRDAVMVNRGVRVRVIYPQTIAGIPRYARYLDRLAGVGTEVRLIDHAPCDLVIQDQQAACLPADPADPPDAMLLIRGSALIKAYSAIYDDFWLRSAPYEPGRPLPDRGEADLTAQERVVIRLMAGGLSDDQIARKMGVHRRTVQRAVSKLMDRLHAHSRFEAGLKLGQDPELARVLRASAAPGGTAE